MPTDDIFDITDRHAAAIELALACRALHSYHHAVDRAKENGADVAGLPPGLIWSEIEARYLRIIDEWLSETPQTAMAASSLVDFVIALTHDEMLSEHFQVGTVPDARSGTSPHPPGARRPCRLVQQVRPDGDDRSQPNGCFGAGR